MQKEKHREKRFGWPGPVTVLLALLVSTAVCPALQDTGESGDTSDKEESSPENSEQAKKYFPSGIKVTPAKKEREEKPALHSFQVEADTELPHRTIVNVLLHYQKTMRKGEEPIDHKVGQDALRVDQNGGLKTSLLDMKRPLWAGPYKLTIQVNPDHQSNRIRNQLPETEDPITYRKTWYYGTEEKREKQKEEAIKQAQEDLHATLRLAGELRRKLRSVRTGNETLEDWKKWSKNWDRRVQKIERSNRRRPTLDGYYLEFSFHEEKTGYFLKYHLKNLRELHEKADTLLRSDEVSRKETRTFRKTYRKLRKKIETTLVKRLNLPVPLSRKKQKQFRKTLNNLSDRFRKLRDHTEARSEATDFENWSETARKHVDQIREILFQLDPDVPDFLYRRFTELTEPLNKFARSLSKEQGNHTDTFKSLYNSFTDVRERSRTYLQKLNRDDGGK